MRFADIPGHEDTKRRLREMADADRIPHALLLEGPAGIGKMSLARAFAQYIHCTNRTPDGDSCGKCPACLQHESFNHIDTVFSFPVVKRSGGRATLSEDYIDVFREYLGETKFMDFDRWRMMLDDINAKPQIYVDEGTELLRRLTFKARQSKYKVVLLWLPERMMEATANKMLKLVEEPFGDTIFVMVSDNPRAILPTIYSRTQRLAVKRYEDSELAEILTGMGFDADTARHTAAIAEGNMAEAIKLAGISKERAEYLDLFTDLMRKAYARRVADLREWSRRVADSGREPAMQFIEYSCRMLRESFIMHLQDSRLLTLNNAESAFIAKFFPFINEKNVEELIELFDAARRDIAANGNAKIIFFDLAVRTIMLIRRK